MSRLDVSKKEHDTHNFSPIIRSGLAGGIAGCVAKTVVAPLDRVKILFQASNPDFVKYAGSWTGFWKAGSEIYSQHGVRGLLQGHSATLLRVFPYAAIKFMAYDQIHLVLMPDRQRETNTRRFLAGALSGMVSVCFTYPLEIIRVRMAFQTRETETSRERLRPSLLKAMTNIYNESAVNPERSKRSTASGSIFDRYPLLKFYRGFTVTLIGMVPYAGTSFLCWGYLRSQFVPAIRPGAPKAKTPFSDLWIGAVSGAVGQTVSYPFEVVRRRMQIGGITRPDRWIGFGETVRSIWRTDGPRGFFVGLSIGFLKIVPMTAVSFAVWQSGKQLLHV